MSTVNLKPEGVVFKLSIRTKTRDDHDWNVWYENDTSNYYSNPEKAAREFLRYYLGYVGFSEWMGNHHWGINDYFGTVRNSDSEEKLLALQHLLNGSEGDSLDRLDNEFDNHWAESSLRGEGYEPLSFIHEQKDWFEGKSIEELLETWLQRATEKLAQELMRDTFNSFEGKQDGQMRGYVPAEWSYSIEKWNGIEIEIDHSTP